MDASKKVKKLIRLIVNSSFAHVHIICTDTYPFLSNIPFFLSNGIIFSHFLFVIKKIDMFAVNLEGTILSVLPYRADNTKERTTIIPKISIRIYINTLHRKQ